jgi:hypothetical protein
VCLSLETYASLPVEKNELARAPGLVSIARSIKTGIASLEVASPFVWNTKRFDIWVGSDAAEDR